MLHDAIEEPFFLSKWFNKKALPSEEPFCFTKRLFVVKEGYSDYKKVRKRWIFKEPLSDRFIVETKMVLLCEELFKAPLLLRMLEK